MLRLAIILSIVFLSSTTSIAQRDSVYNKSSLSVAAHILGYKSAGNLNLFYGLQTDIPVFRVDKIRFSLGANYYENSGGNRNDTTYSSHQSLILGGGFSFPIRKGWFLFQPAIHGIYNYKNIQFYQGDTLIYNWFNGAGVKFVLDFAVNIKGNCDLGWHLDFGAAYGKVRERDIPEDNNRNLPTLNWSTGLFIQFPLSVFRKR